MIDKINDKNIITRIKQDADALLLCTIRAGLPTLDFNSKYPQEALKNDIAKLAESILQGSTKIVESLRQTLEDKQKKHEEILKLKNLIEFMLISHNEIKNITASLIDKINSPNKMSDEPLNNLNDLHGLALNFCRDWTKVSNYISSNDLESDTDLTQITLENTTENIDNSPKRGPI